MKFEDYLEKQKNLLKKYREEVKELAREYASAHNSIQKGDIITDHIGSIRVENISVEYSALDIAYVPKCIYEGLEVKKDGTPFKKGTKRTVWQSNLKMH